MIASGPIRPQVSRASRRTVRRQSGPTSKASRQVAAGRGARRHVHLVEASSIGRRAPRVCSSASRCPSLLPLEHRGQACSILGREGFDQRGEIGRFGVSYVGFYVAYFRIARFPRCFRTPFESLILHFTSRYLARGCGLFCVNEELTETRSKPPYCARATIQKTIRQPTNTHWTFGFRGCLGGGGHQRKQPRRSQPPGP